MKEKKTYFTGKPCKYGHLSERYISDSHCIACTRLKSSKYYQSNKEQKKESGKRWYVENKEYKLNKSKDHYLNNKHLYLTRVSRRRAFIKNAYPKWMDEELEWMIKEIYHLATLRNKATGIKWHVDHIIPLQGKNVCGLHVPTNLQVIPAKENLVKHNSFIDQGY